MLHVTGRGKLEGTQPHDRLRVFEYCDSMPQLLHAADLVVCRAGGSVWEVAAAGVPAILVPWSGATGDHQTANSRYFVAGAVVVPDAELDGARLRVRGRLAAGRRAAPGRSGGGDARPGAAGRGVRRGRRAAEAGRDTSGVTKHLLGIGGIGMSGIARVLHGRGEAVSGCDRADGPVLDALRALGIPCSAPHDPSHLDGVDELIVSSAVDADEPELVRARELGLPVRHRSEALAEHPRQPPAAGRGDGRARQDDDQRACSPSR